MKIGFSSICCPAWDMKTIFEQAVSHGFEGIELRGLQGELHLPNHPELARNGDALVEVSERTGVQIVCLGTSASFSSNDRHEVGDEKAGVRAHIELAGHLRCPCVRVFTGDIPRSSNRHGTLGRIAEALADLAHFASGHRVTLLIENSGELASSRDLWFVVDAVSHPALEACWNPLTGYSAGERSTLAVPRLGAKLGMVHVTDGTFEGRVLQSYRMVGEGNIDVPRLVELLTGIAYDGFLMLEWPKLWDDSLAGPDQFLPHAAKYMKDLLDVKRSPLSAYKGDKKAPKFGPRAQRMPLRG